jgi:hypothetical protein
VVLFVVERYWPGVSEKDVDALARSLTAAAAGAGSAAYLGSALLVGDDVVQCRFQAHDESSVRELNERAGAAYDRILRVYPA